MKEKQKASCNPRDNLITSKGAKEWFFFVCYEQSLDCPCSKIPENVALGIASISPLLLFSVKVSLASITW